MDGSSCSISAFSLIRPRGKPLHSQNALLNSLSHRWVRLHISLCRQGFSGYTDFRLEPRGVKAWLFLDFSQRSCKTHCAFILIPVCQCQHALPRDKEAQWLQAVGAGRGYDCWQPALFNSLHLCKSSGTACDCLSRRSEMLLFAGCATLVKGRLLFPLSKPDCREKREISAMPVESSDSPYTCYVHTCLQLWWDHMQISASTDSVAYFGS